MLGLGFRSLDQTSQDFLRLHAIGKELGNLEHSNPNQTQNTTNDLNSLKAWNINAANHTARKP